MKTYKIAVIPGDGIGKEVVPCAQNVLDVTAKRFGFKLSYDEFDWSCERYQKSGAMMPEDGLRINRNHDAIFWGAVGFAGVAYHVSLGELLLPIRRHFEQHANIRPVLLMPGVRSPLAEVAVGDIDFVVVRENTDGEYSSMGGLMREGTSEEAALQISSFTQKGTDRILKYAFELAKTRENKHVTSATKSNGLAITMPYWDTRFQLMAQDYPDITTDAYHIDILCAHLVLNPQRFDVIVASNLFGDILSDLGPACAGTIGIAPSANLNPEHDYPSMFEPVHGSAPDIYGKNIANPIGQIWSGAMMLDHLGEAEASHVIIQAIESVLTSGPRTPDLKGNSTTTAVGQAVADAVQLV